MRQPGAGASPVGGPRLSRRALLGAFGAGAAVAAGAGAAGLAAATTRQPAEEGNGSRTAYAFHGPHQAGIVTPPQSHLYFAALDVTAVARQDLITLLTAWTAAISSMVQGREVGSLGAVGGPYDAPPQDTGEALGLPASGLTVTIGFGPTLFVDDDGRDRFGLAGVQPPGLRPLPHFPGDAIDPAISGGDLCIQACADDAQVAVHAVRNLVRLAFGTAVVRWSQAGFGQAVPAGAPRKTPRNLFGFKDGTANIAPGDDAALNKHVWVQADDHPAWLSGGSFLVARKIRMTIETWDRTSLREQENVFGRTKKEGAPLSGGGEFDAADFALQGRDGTPLIPVDSHVALAHPSANGGTRILRRAYNYVDGSDGLGRLDAGLFFLAFQRDIAAGFLPMQQRLARADLLNEYIRHIGSATFAIPAGVSDSTRYLGQSLLDS